MIKKKIKAALVLFFGVFFVLLGFVGFVLPVLQGWLFMAIGLILLSLYFPSLRHKIEHYTQKWPKLHHQVVRVQQWMERNVGELSLLLFLHSSFDQILAFVS